MTDNLQAWQTIAIILGLLFIGAMIGAVITYYVAFYMPHCHIYSDEMRICTRGPAIIQFPQSEK